MGVTGEESCLELYITPPKPVYVNPYMELHLYSFVLQESRLTTPFKRKKRLLFVKHCKFIYKNLLDNCS